VYVKCRNESQYGSSRLEIHMQNNLSSTVGNYSTTLGKRAWQLFVLDAALEKLAWSKRCVSITDVFNSQDGFSNFMNLLQGSSKFFFFFFFYFRPPQAENDARPARTTLGKLVGHYARAKAGRAARICQYSILFGRL